MDPSIQSQSISNESVVKFWMSTRESSPRKGSLLCRNGKTGELMDENMLRTPMEADWDVGNLSLFPPMDIGAMQMPAQNIRGRKAKVRQGRYLKETSQLH